MQPATLPITSSPAEDMPLTSPPSPWDEMDETGTGLTVDNFITARISRTINVMRRQVTFPYAELAGLSVPEWRLLSYVAWARDIPFSDLVVRSTSDKALVSRAVRSLEQQGLVRVDASGATPRKKLTVSITREGEAVHERIIPIARARQAEMLRVLEPEERRCMFHALQKLYDHCVKLGPIGMEAGTGSD